MSLRRAFPRASQALFFAGLFQRSAGAGRLRRLFFLSKPVERAVQLAEENKTTIDCGRECYPVRGIVGKFAHRK
jgi:hypothetical protein